METRKVGYIFTIAEDPMVIRVFAEGLLYATYGACNIGFGQW